MRRLALLVIAVLAAGATLAGCTSTPEPTAPAGGFTVYPVADRKPAPKLTGEQLGGGSFDSAAHAGDVLVVNFWASWCGPCVLEAPDFEATYQATKAEKVTFVGVNTRDLRDAATAFATGRTTYPSIFDSPGKVALTFAIPPTGIPSTVIVDRQGRVAAVIFSYVLRSTLEPTVRQIAAEAA
jgi:thiol-disulfide isomerase/thioredoxin